MNDITKTLITTIIPTYRRPKLLLRAIKSVLNQTYPHFQICVYDNASGDETASVVTELAKDDPRVKYHCHPENIGAAKNFAYGLEHVGTPFFSFLSDDDILLPEFYQTAMDSFGQYSEAMMFAGQTIGIDEKGRIIYVSLFSWQRDGLYMPPEGTLKQLKYGGIVWTSTLIRSEIRAKIGLDMDIVASDSDFIYRIGAHFPIIISKKPLAILMKHASSFGVKSGYYVQWPSWEKAISNLTNDEELAWDFRICAGNIMKEQYMKTLTNNCLKEIGKRNFNDVDGVIDSIYNYNYKMIAIFLRAIAKLRKYFPPAFYLFIFLNKARRLFRDTLNQNKIKQKELQKQFGHYAKYLKLSDDKTY